jgi:hypothetical protein
MTTSSNVKSERLVTRIGTILHLDMTSEGVLAREFLKVPLSRRQSWLRELLVLGSAAEVEVLGQECDIDLDAGALEKLKGRVLRLQVHLDSRVVREAALLVQYVHLPRSRRGRFVRDLLMVGQQVRNATTATRMVNIGALIVQSMSKSTGGGRELPVYTQEIVTERDALEATQYAIPFAAPMVEKTGNVVKPMNASMLRGLMTGGSEMEA